MVMTEALIESMLIMSPLLAAPLPPREMAEFWAMLVTLKVVLGACTLC